MHAMRPMPIYTKQFRDILVVTGAALLDSYNFLQNFFSAERRQSKDDGVLTHLS